MNIICTLFRVLVGSSGLEPPTSRLSAECSSQLSYKPIFGVGQLCFRLFPHLFASLDAGGDEGNRTLDPLLAGQVLSQLSYTPMGLVFLFGFEQSSKIEQQAIRTSLSLVGSFPLKDTRSYFTLSCVASHSP